MTLPKKQKTETMSVSESRKQYSEILNRVYRDQQQIIIEKNGIPVAAIVPISVVQDAERSVDRRKRLLKKLEAEDLKSRSLTMEELDREGQEAIKILERVQAGFKGIPEEELEREIANAIAEVEAGYDAERRSSQ
jgi:prevent-host-death family protein